MMFFVYATVCETRGVHTSLAKLQTVGNAVLIIPEFYQVC